jgi:hypothetical protein
MEPLSEFVLSCSVFCSRASVDSVNLNLLKSRNRLGNRMKILFDVHTSKASKELKVVLLHLWRVNVIVKTSHGFIYVSLGDFHIDETAP